MEIICQFYNGGWFIAYSPEDVDLYYPHFEDFPSLVQITC